MKVAKNIKRAKYVVVGGAALLYGASWLAGIWTLVVLGTLVLAGIVAWKLRGASDGTQDAAMTLATLAFAAPINFAALVASSRWGLYAIAAVAAPASNDAVLIVSGADAREYGLETLADLSRVPGARPKFLAQDAAPGWAGGGLFSASASASSEAGSEATSGSPETLETAYGLSDVAVEQVPDLSARYDALASDATDEEPGVTVGEGYSTDGRIAQEGFVVLEDPEGVVSGPASYHPVPVVSEEWLSENPSAEDALNEASGKLDLGELQALNAALLDGTEPQDAVARWREANGL